MILGISNKRTVINEISRKGGLGEIEIVTFRLPS